MSAQSVSKKKGAAPLDSFFHYTERGGTFSGEIAAGIGMAVLSVCGMFVNMQAVMQMIAPAYVGSDASTVAASGELVAATWFASMIIAFIGSLVIGIVTRRSFVQVTSLGLTSVIVATVGIHSGLTYYNVLLISFVSSIIYAVVAAVPQVRRYAYAALPEQVRRALPAAAGILMAWIAFQLSGLVFTGQQTLANYGTAANLGTGAAALNTFPGASSFTYSTDLYHPQMLLASLAGLIAIVVYVLYVKRRSSNPFGKALIWGTLFFLVACVLFIGVNYKTFNFSMSFLWGRVWMIGAEDAMQAHLTSALASLSLGAIFAKGADFSGFAGNGGNVALLFCSSVLSFVFLLMYDADSTVAAVAAEQRDDAPDADALALPLTVNACTNVLAGLMGTAPVAIGKESVAGTRDGARSGLASVVASIVILISAFVWIIPAIFATITSYSITFNLYGHYGNVLQLLTNTSFTVADVVMALAGLHMAARSLHDGFGSFSQTVPFVATIAGTFLTTNLALGVAAGTVSAALVNARRPKGQRSTVVERVGGMPALVWACVSALILVLSFLA